MRRVLRIPVCVASVLMLLAGAAAWAEGGGGTQQWSSSYQYGAPAFTSAVTLSPNGATVFVTGITNFGPSGRFATVAYDASSGDKRWARQFPENASGEFGFGRVLVGSPDGSRLFVSGYSDCTSECDASSFEGFTTIAYDASTGDRAWVARLATVGGGAHSIGVSPDGSAVFVAGGDGTNGSVIVAYDPSNGDELWRIDGDKAEGYYEGGLSVSPDGGTVYVTDTAPPDYESCFQAGGYRTAAYDAADGRLMWSSTYKVTDGASICGTSTDLDLSADGSMVYVTGYGTRAAGDHSGLHPSGTVAYDARTGVQLWAIKDDGITVLAGDTVVSLEVAPDDSEVFVSGDDCSDYPACSIATLAFDSSNGQRVWASRYDGGGRGLATDLAISPDGSNVFVTGQELMPCYAGCTASRLDAPLVAYDTANGDLSWATTYPNNVGVALAVSPDGGSVYLAGTFTSSTSAHRTLSSRTGPSCTDRCGYSITRFNNRPGSGTFQDSDPALQYNDWRGFFDKTAIGGSYRASKAPGNYAIVRTPKVTSISWLTQVGPRRGKAKVIIDGRSKGVFNLYRPIASARTISFEGLARQTHTVKVKVLGRKSPASRDTWVAVDGFRYRAADGIAQDSSARVRYGSWEGQSTRAASGGTLRKSNSRAAKVSLDFNGRTIRWITMTGPTFGRARVVIDGSAHVVDLYQPTRNSRVAITFRGLPKGAHHIAVMPLNKKAPNSSSTDIVIDAFVARR